MAPVQQRVLRLIILCIAAQWEGDPLPQCQDGSSLLGRGGPSPGMPRVRSHLGTLISEKQVAHAVQCLRGDCDSK